MMLLVLSIWVKTLTGSNAKAGFTFFFMILPALFAPLPGVWLDRVRRRPLLVWGHLASAVAVLPLLLVHEAGQVWIIWAVADALRRHLRGAAGQPQRPAQGADARGAAGRRQLGLQTTKESFRLFGPCSAPAVHLARRLVVALLDAALVPHRGRGDRLDPGAGGRCPSTRTARSGPSSPGGVRHLVGDRILGHMLVGFGITMLVLGFGESAIFALTDHFDRPATFVSVLVSVQGIGAIVGGLSSPTVVRRLGEVGAGVLGLVPLDAAPSRWRRCRRPWPWVLASISVFGVSLPILIVAYMTLLQRRTPQRLMARVSVAAEVVMSVPSAASLALGALLVTIVDWRIIFVVIGVFTLAGAGPRGVLAARRAAAPPDPSSRRSSDPPPDPRPPRRAPAT